MPLSPQSPFRRFLRDLREAVVGTEQDFTTGPLGRAILLLSVPMVLEMGMESVFGVADTYFVARLGSAAVAAVGLTESLLTVIFGIAIGVSMATTALISRRIGEKKPGEASRTAAQAIWVGVALAAPIAGAGIWAAPELLRMMGADSEVVAIGAPYTRIIFAGNGTILLLFLLNAVFRGAGDASLAMRSLALANLVNLVLDPCLIFGLGPFPEWGLAGGAIATTIGRGVGVAFQLRLLGSGRARVRVGLRDLGIDPRLMKHLLVVSVGGVLQFLVATASWLALVRILAVFGHHALAGYTIALRVIIFAILPSWGMSNAAATLVGQSLGAGKPDRAERSVWLTARANVIFLCIVAALFLLYAESIIQLFTTDPAVIPIGVACLRIVSLGYPFYALGMVMVQSLNGAGDTRTPTTINLFCYWLFQIPLAWFLSRRLGPDGVFWAIAVAESLLAVVGFFVVRRGKWKEKVV